MLQAIAYHPYNKKKPEEEDPHALGAPGPSAKTHTGVARRILGSLAAQQPTRLPIAPLSSGAIPTPTRPLHASVRDALQKMAWQPPSILPHKHEEGPTVPTFMSDTAVTVAVHHSPIPNALGTIAYIAIKERDKGVVGVAATGIAEWALDSAIEAFGESVVEVAAEFGLDVALLAPLVPKHSVVPWVIGAHAARIIAEIAAQGVPAFEDDPLRHRCDLDGRYTSVDACIFLGVVSGPGRCWRQRITPLRTPSRNRCTRWASPMRKSTLWPCL